MQRNNRFTDFCSKSAILICAIILCILSAFGFSYIALMGDKEKVQFFSISVLERLPGCVAWIIAFLIVIRIAETKNCYRLIKWGAIAAVALEAIFLFCVTKANPLADSLTCINIASDASQGIWTEFEQGGYLYRFPYQEGFVLIAEGLFHLLPGFDAVCIGLRFMNLAALMLMVVSLCGIAEQLFGEAAAMITAVLTAFNLPVALYVFFLYSNMLMSGFAYCSVWCWLLYLNTRKKRFAVAGGAFIAIAMTIKPTALIMLLAIVIVLLLNAIRRKNWRILIGVIVLLLVVSLPLKMIQQWYGKRSGVEPNPGVSNLVYIAMGLDIQNENIRFAPGWYTGLSYRAYKDANYDYDEMNRRQIELLKENFQYAAANPDKAQEFFVKKIVSQWNDATFGCWWYIVCHVDIVHFETPFQTLWQKSYTWWLNSALGCLQVAGYGSALLGCCVMLRGRKENLEAKILPGVIFTGGFLYLLLSEGKSQYSIIFYPAIFPLCAVGLLWISGKLPRLKNKAKSSHLAGAA